MFLYKNNFSLLKIFGGARAPPGPHGHDATGACYDKQQVCVYLQPFSR